ncbi:hypothetical protein Glove_26g267 [Diversispora epigaea]|uniref:Uncharacterized protein n=1 Tax=Diversispora epigaea TaxID=1348612 RepID=A0A397JI75_9GLOM|nr:hypothetical protein Glove_26g267 [Diversispora epigaea]
MVQLNSAKLEISRGGEKSVDRQIRVKPKFENSPKPSKNIKKENSWHRPFPLPNENYTALGKTPVSSKKCQVRRLHLSSREPEPKPVDQTSYILLRTVHHSKKKENWDTKSQMSIALALVKRLLPYRSCKVYPKAWLEMTRSSARIPSLLPYHSYRVAMMDA